MLMFVSGLKLLDTHSSTSSVVAGIGDGINGSEGGPRPRATLKDCWAAQQQRGRWLEEANLEGQWQPHNLLPFLHPCNRSQAQRQPYSWAPMVWGGARLQRNSGVSLQVEALGAAVVVAPPKAGPLSTGNPLLHARFLCDPSCTRAGQTDRRASCSRTLARP